MVTRVAGQRGLQLGLPQEVVKVAFSSGGVSSRCFIASGRPLSQGGGFEGGRERQEQIVSQAVEVWQPDFLCCAVRVFVVC